MFMLLLAPFAPKLVNCSRHNESLKYVGDFKIFPYVQRLTVPRIIDNNWTTNFYVLVNTLQLPSQMLSKVVNFKKP